MNHQKLYFILSKTQIHPYVQRNTYGYEYGDIDVKHFDPVHHQITERELQNYVLSKVHMPVNGKPPPSFEPLFY